MQNIKYWVELAEYDLETAEALLKSKRYLYVGFMCHQVVEKMLKAHYSRTIKETPPYIHNLDKLAEKTGLDKLMSDVQKDIIDSLSPLNIESRYPAYKERLLKVLTESKCREIIKQTKALKQWIEQQL